MRRLRDGFLGDQVTLLDQRLGQHTGQPPGRRELLEIVQKRL